MSTDTTPLRISYRGTNITWDIAPDEWRVIFDFVASRMVKPHIEKMEAQATAEQERIFAPSVATPAQGKESAG